MACAQPATTPRLVDNPTAIGERQTGRTPDARGVALARVPAHCQARRRSTVRLACRYHHATPAPNAECPI